MSTQVAQTFALPDVGEGLTEAEILTWHVAEGDVVEVNQVIVEIETAKSVVELPSPHAGTVLKIFVAEGETVPVGTVIVSVADPTAPTESVTSDKSSSPNDEDSDEPKLLVGYGAKTPGGPRRRRGHPVNVTDTDGVSVAAGVVAGTPERSGTAAATSRPRAKPPVRKLARTLGVELAEITPSGADGTVTRADVLAAAEDRSTIDDARSAVPDSLSSSADKLVQQERRIPIKGVRKHTAAAMVASAFSAPHVTEFVAVDVTKTLELRDEISRRREFREIKLTPLTFVARAYLRALSATPMATARWDEAAQEIVLADGINLGIAAATPRGLMVPNIKNAETMSLNELAAAISELAQTARAGKTTPAAMASGSTTITNIGVFGIDSGTPILNPGETAILAVGTIRRQPWIVEDSRGERVEPRSVLQLALSFDHRVLDGAEGSQVLATTAELLREPGLALL